MALPADHLQQHFHIFQIAGYVVIGAEMIHSARVIPLDGRPHLGKNLASGWAIRGGIGTATR